MEKDEVVGKSITGRECPVDCAGRGPEADTCLDCARLARLDAELKVRNVSTVGIILLTEDLSTV
jgi:hypothetical protein